MTRQHNKSILSHGADPVSRIRPHLVRCLLTLSATLALPLASTAQAAPDAQYNARFLTQYQKIKNPANGYFSADGVPYHSPETLIVEAPDYGHETTSEAYSFWLWLEAQYGRATGDWRPLNAAWANMEKFMIPSQADQPSNNFYNPGKPATYAAEYKLPSNYPAPLASGVPVGVDPIANELQAAYGTNNIYGMHWLVDVDNWYGYGRCGDGTTKPSYINTFQRGPQESVWETVPHPSCETFRWGRNGGGQGFLSLFIGDANYARQWRYTNAPDADARAVQAIYWASVWAKEQGKSGDVAELVRKASKMGDYLRYAMFDKYFKKIGNCIDKYGCPGGSGAANAQGWRDNQHYLMSWYYAWGGATDPGSGWAWRIGSSHNHFGYQNPMAAWVLSTRADFKPVSPSAAGDWGKSLARQMELYRWLQSADGAIAGGATNSYGGDYLSPPPGTATFYGMYYDEKPVYHDPASNTWFGFQAWSMQRVAEFYYATGSAKAKAVLDKWVGWALANTSLTTDGGYAIPNTLAWSGQPDNWNAAAPGANAGLRVTVVDKTADVGVTAAYARTLIYYAARANHAAARSMSKQLLDRMWAKYQDPIGLAVDETRADYKRFTEAYNPATGSGVYIPNGWTGTNGQGATIDANATFLSMRPKYMQDPKWPVLKAYLDGGPAPKWRYHRFWAQADIAMAMLDYANLIGSTVTPSVIATPGSVAVPEGRNVSVGVKLSSAPSTNVTVSVSKLAGGDPDLNAGGPLVFTPANYNVAQNLVVSAAADADQRNGQARFSLAATGHAGTTVTATEVDDDVVIVPRLVVSGTPLAVPEGVTRSFQVRLAAAPSTSLTVSAVRTSGDTDLAIAGGASLTFTPANWNLNQNVTVAAAADADSVNGAASFTVSAPSATPVSVAATEVDKDVVVAAGCTVEFNTSNDWGNGQVASVTLYNTTSTPINGWSVSWTESNDVTLANAWNAAVSANGRRFVATPVSYNGTVPANGSVSFGMQLGYSGAKPIPGAVSWAGRNCGIVIK